MEFDRPPAPPLHRALIPRRAPRGALVVPRIEGRIHAATITGLARYRQVCGITAPGVPITFPHILASPLHVAIFTHAAMPLPALGLVHVRNTITAHQPLEEGMDLSISCWCEGHRPARSGVEIDLHTVAEADGAVVWEEVSTTLSRAVKGAGGERAGEPEPLEQAVSEPWQLPGDLGRKYARVSGDYNPIHLCSLTARLFGFSRQIIHGMWSVARCLDVLRPDAPATLQVTFRRPVMLPGQVFFSATSDGRFDLRSPKGKLHLYGSVSGSG